MREQIIESRNQREGKYSGWKGRHRRGEGGYMRARDWRCEPTRRQIKKYKMEPQDNDYEWTTFYC